MFVRLSPPPPLIVLLLLLVLALRRSTVRGFSFDIPHGTDCSHQDYHIAESLKAEVEFYDHFNFELSRWIGSQPDQLANPDMRYQLLALSRAQDSAVNACGQNRTDLIALTLNKAMAIIAQNRSLDQTWTPMEKYLRFLGYERSSVIQKFVAEFLDYNKDKTPEKLKGIAEPFEVTVAEFIKNSVPRLLRERTEVFWSEFVRSHTPGIKEKCMRFLPDSTIVNFETLIADYRTSFLKMKAECVPEGEKRENQELKIVIILGLIFLSLICVFCWKRTCVETYSEYREKAKIVK